jgi:hypothetical protein
VANAFLAQRNRKKARLSATDAACDGVLKELDDLRLERDLSYPALSKEMGRAGYPLGPRTLHQLLRHTNPMGRPMRPHDRTLHKIRRFLELMKARADEKPSRGRAMAPRVPA